MFVGQEIDVHLDCFAEKGAMAINISNSICILFFCIELVISLCPGYQTKPLNLMLLTSAFPLIISFLKVESGQSMEPSLPALEAAPN